MLSANLASLPGPSLLAGAALALLALGAPSPASAHDGGRLPYRPHNNALARRAAPAFDGWTSLGCVTEGASGKRALTGYVQQSIGSLTIQACLNTCASMAYLYGGVEYGQECWCSDQLSNSGGASVADSFCNVPCTGDSSVMCGGTSYLTLYRSTDTTCAAASFTSSTSSTTSTSAATTTTTAAAPTALSTKAVTAGSTTFTYQGCVQDGSKLLLQDLKLYPTDNTPAVCVAACSAAGYSYAGVELETRCFCSNSLYTASGLGATIADSRCMETTCPGDSTLYCGGSKAMILYKKNAPALSKATVTSSSTQWTYQGCVQDGSKLLLQDLKLYPSGNTPAVCIALCLDAGFSYAGVELETRCFCSNSLYTASGLGAAIDDPRCMETTCPGDSSLYCGGSKAMILYKKYAPALSKASITSGKTTWAFQGCVQDGSKLILQDLKLYPNGNTPAVCIALCLDAGFSYAGVELETRCFCSNSLYTASGLGAAIDDPRCMETTCPGDSSLYCGGSKAMILYKQA